MQILGIENTNYTEELSESESESEELVESEGKWVGMWGLVSMWASWWVEEGWRGEGILIKWDKFVGGGGKGY